MSSPMVGDFGRGSAGFPLGPRIDADKRRQWAGVKARPEVDREAARLGERWDDILRELVTNWEVRVDVE